MFITYVLSYYVRCKELKKEYVVMEISAAPDGAPYVLASLADPNDIRERQKPRFIQPQMGVFNSMDDLTKNLGRMFSMQTMGGFTTIIKLGLDEYEKLNIKVGDKVNLEISKVEWGTV